MEETLRVCMSAGFADLDVQRRHKTLERAEEVMRPSITKEIDT